MGDTPLQGVPALITCKTTTEHRRQQRPQNSRSSGGPFLFLEIALSILRGRSGFIWSSPPARFEPHLLFQSGLL